MHLAGVVAWSVFLGSVFAAALYAAWTLLAHFRLLRPLIILVLLSTVGVAVWLFYFYDDPSDPGFSAGRAERAVAEELCPKSPDRVNSSLNAYQDSGYYVVYLERPNTRVIAHGNPTMEVAPFSVSRDPSTRALLVTPLTSESSAVQTFIRNSPGC